MLFATAAMPTPANAGTSRSGLFEATGFIRTCDNGNIPYLRVENYSTEKVTFTIEMVHDQSVSVVLNSGAVTDVQLESFATQGLTVIVNSKSHHEYVDDTGTWPWLPCVL